MSYTLIQAMMTAALLPAGGPEPPVVGPEPLGEVIKVLHEGDPAPGIPNAVVTWVGPSHIDGAGNVLVWGDYFDGVSGGRAHWYGPVGDLQPVAYVGGPAFDLPGVTIAHIFAVTLGETGMICVMAQIAGPGVDGTNNTAVFSGHFGDIRLWVRAGQQAPGLEEGVVFPPYPVGGVGGTPTDGEYRLLRADLIGPGVDETNDRAAWIEHNGEFTLIWRRGMIAPGTDGARFRFADGWRVNGFGEATFRGLLVHDENVNYSNQIGSWVFQNGALSMLMRAGDPAWGFPDDVVFQGANPVEFANSGAMGIAVPILGPGIDGTNNFVRWIVGSEGIEMYSYEGTQVPWNEEGVYFGVGSNMWLSECGITASKMRLSGQVSKENDRVVLIHDDHGIRIALREGDAVLGLPGYRYGSLIFGAEATNDKGDILGFSEIVACDDAEVSAAIYHVRDHRTGLWQPYLAHGDIVDGRVFQLETPNDAISDLWISTGGSDGAWQSFNDRRECIVRLEFADGASGLYLLRPRADGDATGDGVVGLDDFAGFEECRQFNATENLDCRAFDIDLDGDIDLTDFGYLQLLWSSS